MSGPNKTVIVIVDMANAIVDIARKSALAIEERRTAAAIKRLRANKGRGL